TNNIAGGATVANVLAGSQFEFVPMAAVVRVYQTTRANLAEVLTDITFGNVLEGQDLISNVSTTGPTTDRDVLASGVVSPGDRIVIRLRNTGVGANDADTLVDIKPL
ncbi:MAG: hypothetical protein ACE5Q3_19600, partial [Alphaproteobacteria bacterium]